MKQNDWVLLMYVEPLLGKGRWPARCFQHAAVHGRTCTQPVLSVTSWPYISVVFVTLATRGHYSTIFQRTPSSVSLWMALPESTPELYSGNSPCSKHAGCSPHPLSDKRIEKLLVPSPVPVMSSSVQPSSCPRSVCVFPHQC